MMTFEEWWRDSKKSVYWCNNPSMESLCKCIAQSAWEASQLQSKSEIDALTKERNKWIKRCDTSVKKAWKASQENKDIT